MADAGDDDAGWWNCSLCTYKNSADRFTCEMCDLRRGTSTRKPRCSADTIVAQVVKQQEQIRQQTRAKPSPKSKTSTSNSSKTSIAVSDSASKSKKLGGSRISTPSVSGESRLPTNVSNSESPEVPAKKEKSDRMSKKVAAKLAARKSRGPRIMDTGLRDDEDDFDTEDSTDSDSLDSDESTEESSDNDASTNSESTSEAKTPGSKKKPTKRERPAPELSLDNSSQYSSSSAMTPEPTTSSPANPNSIESPLHPFKIRPVEINGNLIKYAPPTSSGRTGLIIDKKRFTQHSVTVNDVTITFTEFATRQNKYIRKKKKKKKSGRSLAPPENNSSKVKTEAKSEPE